MNRFLGCKGWEEKDPNQWNKGANEDDCDKFGMMLTLGIGQDYWNPNMNALVVNPQKDPSLRVFGTPMTQPIPFASALITNHSMNDPPLPQHFQHFTTQDAQDE